MFKDRQTAAEELSEKLKNSRKTSRFDAVIPVTFSGFQTAEKVANELDLPIRPLISSKLKVPGKASLEFGAVTHDGTIWLDDAMVEEFMIDRDFIREIAAENKFKLRKRLEAKNIRPKLDIRSKNVLIVTDGIASGMQTSASLGACLKNGAESITVATPFISKHALEDISKLAENLIYLKKPRFVASVRDGYAAEFRENSSKISREV